MRKLLLLGIWFHALVCCAFNDTLVLMNGKTVKGNIIAETGNVIIFQAGTGRRYRVEKSKLKNIIRGTEQRAPAAASAETQTEPPPHHASDIHIDDGKTLQLGIAAGLATTEGQYGGTFLVGLSIPAGERSPFRIGVDTGLFFSQSTWLPLLVSAVYEFEGPSGIHPYLGAAIGPFISLSSNTATINTNGQSVQVTTGTGNGVLLAILARPGCSFPLSDTVNATVELTFGGLTGVFYIAPTVGLTTHI